MSENPSSSPATGHLSTRAAVSLVNGALAGPEAQVALIHIMNCNRCMGDVMRLSDKEETTNFRLKRDEAAPPSSSQASNDSRLSVGRDVYAGLLDRVFRSVLKESELIENQRSIAGELAAELKTLSLEQQRLVIENSPRYNSWALVEQLLIEAQNLWVDDPRRAERIAVLARIAAERIDVSGYRRRLLADLKAEAWSYIANCRRILSDMSGANEAFREAEALLETGTGDSMERARLLNLKASYLLDSRRFDEAAVALEEAIRGFKSAPDHHLEGRALLLFAKLLRDQGDTEQSLMKLRQAEPLLDFGRDPYLEFHHQYKIFVYLVDLHRLDEARQLLPRVRELARKHARRLDRLRLLWTEGLLCRASGQKELAEAALLQVREGFIAEGIGFDVALVSLDLAGLYQEAGCVTEVRQLAVETMPIFASLNVQRELVMAWTLFMEATRQDLASFQVIDQVASRIRAARDGARKTGSDQSQ
jgi:tetratricopeptide (TPR) repeat protein